MAAGPYSCGAASFNGKGSKAGGSSAEARLLAARQLRRPNAGDKAGRGGKASTSGKKKHEDNITARFILGDLVDGTTEDDVREYFQFFGDIEQVTIKTLSDDQLSGSVKFADPYPELRATMLNQTHTINGAGVTVQTHKMLKKIRASKGGKPAKTNEAESEPDAAAEEQEE